MDIHEPDLHRGSQPLAVSLTRAVAVAQLEAHVAKVVELTGTPLEVAQRLADRQALLEELFGACMVPLAAVQSAEVVGHDREEPVITHDPSELERLLVEGARRVEVSAVVSDYRAQVKAHRLATLQSGLPGEIEHAQGPFFALFKVALPEGGLSSEHRNVVQFSAPAPVAAESLDEAVELLSANLLVIHAPQARGETRSRARSLLRRSLKSLVLDGTIDEHVELTAGNEQRVTMDFAVSNGEVRQLSHAWSFRAGRPDDRVAAIQSWAWVVRTLRDEGGTLDLGGADVDVASDVDVEVFVLPPKGSSRDYESALATFDQLEIPVIEESADPIAMRADELVVAAHR